MAPQDPSSLSDSTSLFISSLSGWGNMSGSTILMVRYIFIGSTGAGVFGLASAIVGLGIVGAGALPFALGACAGFTFSILNYYQHTISRAILALQHEPSLLLLHLRSNFPLRKWDRAQLRDLAEGRSGWVERSMLLTAWQSAGAAFEEIHSQRESAIIKEAVERREDFEVKTIDGQLEMR